MSALLASLGRLTAFLLCVFALLIPGCQPSRAAAPEVLKGSAFVTASFVDRNSLFIEDLNQEEVQIFENDQPRKIQFMAREEVPTVYGLIFELSLLPERPDDDYRGSTLVISGASASRSMAYELIDKYMSRQTVWVGGYDKGLKIVRDDTTDGFSAKAAIQEMHGTREQGESFLYSALVAGVMKMNTHAEKRRVIVVFLDLLDVNTAGKLKPLKNLLSASNVELFVVSFAGRLRSGRDGMAPAISQSSLRELGQATSGEALFAADNRDHFEDMTHRIYNEIRTFYTFGFESEASSDQPPRLTIRCTRPGSKVRHHPLVPALP